MAHLVKCFYCKEQFDTEKEGFVKPRSNRYAHKECGEKFLTPDDTYIEKLYHYLSKVMKIKYDYPSCERQRLNFISKLGYTNEGIYLSIKYFYEVKKGKLDKSGGRIGIIPYVYDEAIVYYKNIKAKQQILSLAVGRQFKKPIIKMVINDTFDHSRTTKLIKLDNISVEEE